MSRRKRRQRPTADRLRRIAVLPSLATLANAVCGFAAIHFTARGMNEPNKAWLERPELTFFAVAGYLIFLAMVADALDGRLARMSRSSSSFGGQLDSLADMVSFGVAPAFLMLRVVENGLAEMVRPASPIFGSIPGRLLWLMAAMYVCCAALRLARFNVENSPEESSHLGFSGLPSPAAGAAVAALVLLYGDLGPELQAGPVPAVALVGSRIVIYTLPFVTVAVSLLMVSRIPYKHILNQLVRGRKPFSHLVLLVLCTLGLIWGLKLQLTLAIASLGFAASGPARWLWQKRSERIRTTHPQAQGDEQMPAQKPSADQPRR